MDKITSFTIDHLKLLPGVYVSRKDRVGDQVITTFDIRMTRPNYEPVMNGGGSHHRAPGCHLAAKQRGVERPRPLLRTDGLPHRLLPASRRRPDI